MAADPSRIAAAAAAAAASASSLYLSSAPVATPMTHFIPVPHRAGEADDGSATDAGATAGEPPTESGDRSPNATDDDEDTSHYSHNTHATPKRKGKTTLRRRRMEQPGASLAAAAASAASAASSVAAIATQAHAMAHSRLTPGGSGTKRRRPAATSSAESSPLKSEKSALFLDPSLDLLLTPTKRGKTQKLRAAPGSANSAVSTMSAEGGQWTGTLGSRSSCLYPVTWPHLTSPPLLLPLCCCQMRAIAVVTKGCVCSPTRCARSCSACKYRHTDMSETRTEAGAAEGYDARSSSVD